MSFHSDKDTHIYTQLGHILPILREGYRDCTISTKFEIYFEISHRNETAYVSDLTVKVGFYFTSILPRRDQLKFTNIVERKTGHMYLSNKGSPFFRPRLYKPRGRNRTTCHGAVRLGRDEQTQHP